MGKLRKNEIFKTIQAAGLDPRDFDLEEGEGKVRVKHKWSESCFTVGGGPGHYVGSCVAGDGLTLAVEKYSWEALISYMISWLGEVKRDLDTPDLWAELRREAELLGANSDDVIENTPFTLDEQNEIAGRLRELAEHAAHIRAPGSADASARREDRLPR